MQHLASRVAANIPFQNTGNAEFTRNIDFDIAGTRYTWTIQLVQITWQWWVDSVDPSDPLPTFRMSIKHNERVIVPQTMTLGDSASRQLSFTQNLDNGLAMLNRDILRIPWVMAMPLNANLYAYRVELIQATLYGELQDNRPNARYF